MVDALYTAEAVVVWVGGGGWSDDVNRKRWLAADVREGLAKSVYRISNLVTKEVGVSVLRRPPQSDRVGSHRRRRIILIH